MKLKNLRRKVRIKKAQKGRPVARTVIRRFLTESQRKDQLALVCFKMAERSGLLGQKVDKFHVKDAIVAQL